MAVEEAPFPHWFEFYFIGGECFFSFFMIICSFLFCECTKYRFHNCIELNCAFLYIIGPNSNQMSMFIPQWHSAGRFWIEYSTSKIKKFHYDSNAPEIINKLKCFADSNDVYNSKFGILHLNGIGNGWSQRVVGLIKSW